MNSPVMNIGFCCDDRYVPTLAVVINTLCRNSPGKIHLYLLDGGIAEGSWSSLQGMVQGPDRSIIRVVVPRGRFVHAKADGRIPESSYYRIILPELLPELERILFLDCDMLVLRDVRPLYEMDLEGKIVGAVEDLIFDAFDRLGLKPGDRYFNAGVILIDIAAWNRHRMSEVVLDHIRDFPERATWHDQCHLNACLAGHWKILSPRWNLQMTMLKGAAMRIPQNSIEVCRARKDPAIVHFTSADKPWFDFSPHPYKGVFRRELALTPFSAWKAPHHRGTWRQYLSFNSFIRRGQFFYTRVCDFFRN